MKFSKSFRLSCSLFMALWMTNAPSIAFAETAASKLITTNEVVQQLTRVEAEGRVKEFLARQDVRDEFVKRGVSADEAERRLAHLSETEVRQLATQMEQARAGGDILVTILIVVLIIFLIKRI